MTYYANGDSMLILLKAKILSVLYAIFYHNRLDLSGNVFQPKGLTKMTSRFNQSLIEKGYSPPWIWSVEACRNYWSTEVNQEFNANEPQQYSNKSTKLIEFLHNYWKSYCVP